MSWSVKFLVSGIERKKGFAEFVLNLGLGDWDWLELAVGSDSMAMADIKPMFASFYQLLRFNSDPCHDMSHEPCHVGHVTSDI